MKCLSSSAEDRGRSNPGGLTNFAFRWRDPKTLQLPSPFILWLGESKLSTTRNIVALNTSGRDQMLFDAVEWFTDTCMIAFTGEPRVGLGI